MIGRALRWRSFGYALAAIGLLVAVFVPAAVVPGTIPDVTTDSPDPGWAALLFCVLALMVAPEELASGRVAALAVGMPLVALPWLVRIIWTSERRRRCSVSTRLSLMASAAFFALPIGVAVDRLLIGYWVAFTALVVAAGTCATLPRGDEPREEVGRE